MTTNRSGLRELQIARGLITMRWASIPLIFAFGILSNKFLGMSFQIEPIYVLCCFMAILNVFFTIHFSMLSRQISISRGIPGLRKFLGTYLSRFFNELRNRGISGLTMIPAVVIKMLSVMYLMLLESLKDVSFNILSLNNIMHSQVIGDLLLITLLSRYTGTMESPLFFFAVIPIIVAGAVMGFKTGIVYVAAGVGAWVITSLMVKYQIITHIKFYSPVFGDLSQCTEWIVTNSLAMITGLSATAFLAHKLTSVFKERIFYLNDLLYKSNTQAVSSRHTAEQIPEGWLIVDPEGNVEKVKIDRNGFLPSDLAGKNLFKEFPELEQYGIAYVVQSVVAGNSRRILEKIKLTSRTGTKHLFNCRISAFKDSGRNTKLLIIFEDRSEEIYLKNQLQTLRAEITETKTNLEKVSLENRENQRSFKETLKCANERAIEIEVLNQKLNKLKNIETNYGNKISNLMDEVASLKSENDHLVSELQHKQIILEEVCEMMAVCHEIESLTSMIEHKTTELFKLDNSCLHIFRSDESGARLNEILDIRKASPRLLDIPRKSPKTLEPVLNEGRPVIINARITPEKEASMAITNGSLQRLVAYIPLRHLGKTLGMMMLEKYGCEKLPEDMISSLSFFLKYCAAAVKSALQSQKIREKNSILNQSLSTLYTQLDSIKAMVFNHPSEENQPFSKIIFEFGRNVGLKDAIVARIHNDDSIEVTARFDRSRALELDAIENEILKTIKNNPNNKATTQLVDEETTCIAYPLLHGNRLLGVLFTYYYKNSMNQETTSFTDLCVRLIRDQLALYIMTEEKELWESFYRANLSA